MLCLSGCLDDDLIQFLHSATTLTAKVHSEVLRGTMEGNELEWLTSLDNDTFFLQQWDPELARVAQKWADQCSNVDYKNDQKRKDPVLFHDSHAYRKTRE